MMIITFILILLSSYSSAKPDDCAVKYLQQYGYLEKDNSTLLQENNNVIFSQALEHFQEAYELKMDGTLNQQTLRFMKIPRCGVSDNIHNFHSAAEKWNKTHIKWNYYLASPDRIRLTKEAFKIWEDQTQLTFEYNKINPDIIISDQRLIHFRKNPQELCIYDLDGMGGVLAHAFFPSYDRVTEIHIDADERWSYEKVRTPPTKYSLFQVLVHEIGHALGIHHTFNNKSVMYAAYSDNWTGKLDQVDIMNIQNLYGPKKVLTTTPNKTPETTITPSTTPVKQVPVISPHNIPILCDIEHLKTFLIADRKMFVFHSKWVWPIDITTNKKILKPFLINDLLKFLPRNVKRISHIYQRPSGEIVFFVNNDVYMVTYPDMRLVVGYPKKPFEVFSDFSQYTVINGVIDTYTGKTYIFHDHSYYAEINECDFKTVKRGFISELFPGIPHNIQSVFRYNNGIIYFFKGDIYYEFNEFTRSVVRTGTFNLSIFDITCSHPNILDQLYQLLHQLKTKYIGYITALRDEEDENEDRDEALED